MQLNITWVPRDANVIADEVSKFVDYDDWTTSDAFFTHISREWGPFTIDRFASHKNTKTKRFNTLFWNPDCEAVDAFTQDWGKWRQLAGATSIPGVESTSPRQSMPSWRYTDRSILGKRHLLANIT